MNPEMLPNGRLQHCLGERQPSLSSVLSLSEEKHHLGAGARPLWSASQAEGRTLALRQRGVDLVLPSLRCATTAVAIFFIRFPQSYRLLHMLPYVHAKRNKKRCIHRKMLNLPPQLSEMNQHWPLQCCGASTASLSSPATPACILVRRREGCRHHSAACCFSLPFVCAPDFKLWEQKSNKVLCVCRCSLLSGSMSSCVWYLSRSVVSGTGRPG